MRFIYTAGAYTQFMGRMFAFKRATEVTDKATIAALLKHPDFMRVDDAPAAPSPAIQKRPLLTLGRKR